MLTRYDKMARCLVASFEDERKFCCGKLLVIFSIENSMSVVAPARAKSVNCERPLPPRPRRERKVDDPPRVRPAGILARMFIADHAVQTTRECCLNQLFDGLGETPISGDVSHCSLSHEKAALYFLDLNPI